MVKVCHRLVSIVFALSCKYSVSTSIASHLILSFRSILKLPGLAEDFVGNFGHVATLVARSFELVLARLAAAVEAGDRGGAIGRAARDLTQLSQPSEAVRQAHDHHAEMQ